MGVGSATGRLQGEWGALRDEVWVRGLRDRSCGRLGLFAFVRVGLPPARPAMLLRSSSPLHWGAGAQHPVRSFFHLLLSYWERTLVIPFRLILLVFFLCLRAPRNSVLAWQGMVLLRSADCPRCEEGTSQPGLVGSGFQAYGRLRAEAEKKGGRQGWASAAGPDQSFVSPRRARTQP